MRVYLSSTLSDLGLERDTVKKALSGESVVVESYEADPRPLWQSCIDDVASCDLYIGIVGLRYGFIPPGQTKPITELEFDAAAGMDRLVFIKSAATITHDQTDAGSGEHDISVIKAFRERLSSGKEGYPRPAQFADLQQLTQHLFKALRRLPQGFALEAAEQARPVAMVPQEHAATLPDAQVEEPGIPELSALAKTFASPAFGKFSGVVPWSVRGLPTAIEEAAQNAGEALGEKLSVALFQLVLIMSEALRDESVVLTRSECAVLRKQLKSSMGFTARLCISHTAVAEVEADLKTRKICRSIAATEVAGAMLAARLKPHTMWKCPDRPGGAALEDAGAITVPIEMGDSKSASMELGLALFRNLHPAVACPSVLDGEARERLRAALEIARLEDKARYFVLADGSQAVLTPELEQWITQELGTAVLVCRPAGPPGALFLYDEKTLLALIARFLQILDEPEWNPV